jgi:hypothetical protein
MAEFVEYGKTKRLFRDIIVTEKIDGTNVGLHIEPLGDVAEVPADTDGLASGAIVLVGHDLFKLTAQSRNRLIYPGKGTDNYGFAEFVRNNGAELVTCLGVGLHFGEWWGQGINRGYGVSYRRWSLFNTDKYKHVNVQLDGAQVDTVPVLYHGTFSGSMIFCALEDLAENGSKAAPGYDDPEGIVIYHSQARMNFKVTLNNNDAGKWEVATT